MRTLLAAAAMVMLVGAGTGCGDDTTSNLVHDMAMTANDLSVPVMTDMSMLNCGQIIQCASNCTTLTCAQQCATAGKSASQTKFGALIQCAATACTTDGGVDQTCTRNTIGAGLLGNGPCKTQGQACASDQ